MTESLNLMLYSERDNEVDEYARLVRQAQLPVQMTVCRSPDDAVEKIAGADIVFGVHLPPQAYASARRLKWIQSMWAGVEGLLRSPVPEPVIITKPFGVFGKFISHYVFGNLLAWKIKYGDGLAAQAQCKWTPYRIELLQGRRMGIAGFGDIGADIARIARAFEMEVWGLARETREHELAHRIFSVAGIKEFVSGVDVLVLILPSTPATCGMFNLEILSLLKPDALIINVGRGALIDDDALVQLLEEKKVAGAILDVFREEPLPARHPYWSLPNCIVTPHVGGPSLPEDITRCFLENFGRYQRGEPLLGLVDRRRGY